jgi:hypothetical protein
MIEKNDTIYLCYGDDSVSKKHIGFVIIGIKEDFVEEFLSAYGDLKEKYSIDRQYVFHCNELFHDGKRKKNRHLKHLNRQQIMHLFNDIVNLYSQVDADGNTTTPVMATRLAKDYPESFVNKISIDDGLNFDRKRGIRMTEDICLSQLKLAAKKDGKNYRYHQAKIGRKDRVAKNSTPWQRIIKPYNMMPGLDTTSENPEFSRRNLIKYDNAPYKQMYEIADFFAYTLVVSLSRSRSKYMPFFRDIYIRIANQSEF